MCVCVCVCERMMACVRCMYVCMYVCMCEWEFVYSAVQCSAVQCSAVYRGVGLYCGNVCVC